MKLTHISYYVNSFLLRKLSKQSIPKIVVNNRIITQNPFFIKHSWNIHEKAFVVLNFEIEFNFFYFPINKNKTFDNKNCIWIEISDYISDNIYDNNKELIQYFSNRVVNWIILLLINELIWKKAKHFSLSRTIQTFFSIEFRSVLPLK